MGCGILFIMSFESITNSKPNGVLVKVVPAQVSDFATNRSRNGRCRDSVAWLGITTPRPSPENVATEFLDRMPTQQTRGDCQTPRKSYLVAAAVYFFVIIPVNALTTEGSKLIRKIYADHAHDMEDAFSYLDDSEKEVLAKLQLMVENMSGWRL